MRKKSNDIAHLICAAAFMASAFPEPKAAGKKVRTRKTFPLPAFGAQLSRQEKPSLVVPR